MPAEGYLNREQSLIKHLALGRYLEVAARIIGPHRDIAYIDCCAGPWGSRTTDFSDTSFGVALRALNGARGFLESKGKRPEFRALLVENNPDSFVKLKSFADALTLPGIAVRVENWDFTEHLGEIVDYAQGRRAFPFIFVDPKGWRLAQLNMIEPLLRLNPGEVLINLMSSFITRFINDATLDFTNLLGANFAELRKLDGADQEDEVVRRYCDAIRRVGGFPYVCALPVMKPDRDEFHFHLIYATRHPLGVTKFKEVEKRVAGDTHVIRAEKQKRTRELRSGMTDLFEPDVLYRESRYQRLERKNRGLAGTAVLELLRNSRTVEYDQCWTEAMQFASVHESDLRGWLAAWESEGLIEITGRKSPTERLKTKAQHQVSLRS